MQKWCQGGELNSRPRAYESPALPLSYPGPKEGGEPKGTPQPVASGEEQDPNRRFAQSFRSERAL